MRNVKTICYTQALIVCVIAFCSGTAHAQAGYAYAERKKFSATNKEERDDRVENAQKQKLFTVLKQLNESKGIYFLFSEQSLADKMVNPVETSGNDIEKILTQVLKNTGLKFKKINDKTFVILSKDNSGKKESLDVKPMDVTMTNEVVHAERSQSEANFEIITGKVVGTDGLPMPGISITVKGTRKGTSTKADGTFAIDANKGEVLVVSSIGFVTQEIAVGNQTNIAITLLEENKQLNEVVVT